MHGRLCMSSKFSPHPKRLMPISVRRNDIVAYWRLKKCSSNRYSIHIRLKNLLPAVVAFAVQMQVIGFEERGIRLRGAWPIDRFIHIDILAVPPVFDVVFYLFVCPKVVHLVFYTAWTGFDGQVIYLCFW